MDEIPVSYGHGHGCARGHGKGSAKSARTGAAGCQLPLQGSLGGSSGHPHPWPTHSHLPKGLTPARDQLMRRSGVHFA